MNSSTKKAIRAFLVLLLMAGVYSAIIALCYQYVKHHDMQSQTAKYILGIFLFAGYYFIYRWFAGRLRAISKE
ncbi:MAG: hypothetical protein K2M12_03180 [Muribaculaceae bacterium]|nr:hypothetical protein [Muribaculaceae bacterium]